MDYQISIIMPALNEEKNIANAIRDVIKAFMRYEKSGEIIVINDGSVDGTEAIVNEFIEKNKFIRMISHDRTRGIGASFWEGVAESRGEIVTLIPGDAENDSSEILRYLPLMDHVDIVIPFLYNKLMRPWKRRLISIIYKAIINLSFGLLLNYMNGAVMYRKSILKSITLRNSGFFFQTEILIKALKKGYLYAEVPYAIKIREEGESKALTLKSLVKVINGYFSTIAGVYFFDKVDRSKVPDSVTYLRYKEIESNACDRL